MLFNFIVKINEMKIVQILTVLMLSMVFGISVAAGMEVQPDIPVTLSIIGGFTTYFSPVDQFALGVFNWGALNFTPGAANVPGTQQIGYFIPKADITTWPAIDDATNTIATDFTLAVGKFWIPFYGTQEKGKVDFEPQGEVDNESFLNKASWFHPGQKAEALAFAAQAVQDDLVYALIETDGTIRIVGDEKFKTITKPTGTTGDARSSAKGMTLEISCIGIKPAPIYTGTLPTA